MTSLQLQGAADPHAARPPPPTTDLGAFLSPGVRGALRRGDVQVRDVEITAMFCDISGYSRLTRHMPPRDVFEMLAGFFPAAVEEILLRGGTVEKFAGDAILAVWGAPWSWEDDVDNALGAALAIRDRARRRAVDTRRQGPAFSLHIGLSTGAASIGVLGGPGFVQYCTLGGTTTRAARLCAVARPDAILCDEPTWARAQYRPPGATPLLVPLHGLGAPERARGIP